ncbi:Os07g0650300 [Oryza sativa Japonica Group]|uniref:Os07g0650300 protein n=2 Tax=Oryza sativa subsp. japonica TaxID=39947 RepID=Q0D426_ORYSJ|nr:hypothetical protein EE612_041062 [Oryza sativa]BAF22397.1 Os07g0650300 [Oryza sativa Japonica Group]BAT02957.1 Os07g0650300 [Oryza sativa Japonica Group]|eukprot:NP_001060483.1 Os07g0650300 [Oryza sativa Japonica Group]
MIAWIEPISCLVFSLMARFLRISAASFLCSCQPSMSSSNTSSRFLNRNGWPDIFCRSIIPISPPVFESLPSNFSDEPFSIFGCVPSVYPIIFGMRSLALPISTQLLGSQFASLARIDIPSKGRRSCSMNVSSFGIDQHFEINSQHPRIQEFSWLL